MCGGPRPRAPARRGRRALRAARGAVSTALRAGICAAGLGERLRAEGIDTPKSLVAVGGRPLLAHAIDALRAAGAGEVWIAINARDAARAEAAIGAASPSLPLHWIRRTTASSLETFSLLVPALADGDAALVAMVDGVFPPDGLVRFAEAVARVRDGTDAMEGVIGVTARPDDDRPLRVHTDASGRVLAIGEDAGAARLSTAGLYLLPRRALLRGPALLAAGGGALRELLAAIVREGVRLRACDLGAVVDVDRADDLAAAEALWSPA